MDASLYFREASILLLSEQKGIRKKKENCRNSGFSIEITVDICII